MNGLRLGLLYAVRGCLARGCRAQSTAFSFVKFDWAGRFVCELLIRVKAIFSLKPDFVRGRG